MGEERMSWEAGAALAGELIEKLLPACKRLAVGGSLRRGSRDVGDVELIAISDGEALYEVIDGWLADGVVQKRLKGNGSPIAWARRYRAMIYDGVPVDLFITCPPQWGLIYLIRTGPGKADGDWKGGANQFLVTSRRQRGLLPSDLKIADGWIWRGEKRVDTPEEVDVFRLLGIPFIAPYLRSISTYSQWKNDKDGGLEALRERQWHPGLNRVPRSRFWPAVGWGRDRDQIYEACDGYYQPYSNDTLIRLAGRIRGPIAGRKDGMIGGTGNVTDGAVAAGAN